jgi:hypothetical protein
MLVIPRAVRGEPDGLGEVGDGPTQVAERLMVAPNSMVLERNVSQHLRSLHHSPMFLASGGVVMHSFASWAIVVMACSITGLSY